MSVAVRAGSVGARVADARRELGLTQKHFAKRVGITLWLLDRIETGVADAALHLAAIADVTGRPPAWFTGASVTVATSPRTARPRLVSTVQSRVVTGRDLVLASLALLVLIRFFTEVVPVLPRAANFVDIPIFLVLSAAALTRRTRPVSSPSFRAAVILFLFVCGIAVLANLSRIEPGPVLVFLYGFLAPIGVGAAVYALWPAGQAHSLSRALVALGVIQLLVVALIDLPRFISSGNPDVVSGTFGTNAYQLVFFLLVFTALLAGIFTFEKKRAAARFAVPLFGAVLATVFLAQYRALLVTSAITVLFIGALVGTRGRGIVAATFVAAAFVLSLAYVAQHFPGLRFAPTVSSLQRDPGFYVTKRLQAAKSVVHLFNDHPRFLFTGTGPGTFSSRAWQTFANANSKSRSNVQGGYVRAITGGRAYSTDVSEKYVAPLEAGPVIGGSRAVTAPFSSYTSLVAEVGLIGFFLMAGVYIAATGRSIRLAQRSIRGARPGDPVPALLVACAAGFVVLLQMGFLDNWLEVTRVTFLVWMLFGAMSKELSSRDEGTAP